LEDSLDKVQEGQTKFKNNVVVTKVEKYDFQILIWPGWKNVEKP
jgi:hypothetical protein